MSSKTQTGSSASTTLAPRLVRYNRFLLLVAGLGGLLYGIDVGIIGGALPYLEATSHLTPAELSIVVAAVLLGSVFSTLFAGLLADWMGRKPLMILAGVAPSRFRIPVIALRSPTVHCLPGGCCKGMSGGIVGVVVPLYLAECLSADKRGRGTGVFQWLLTLGIFAAALIGVYFSYHVAALEKTGIGAGAVPRQGPRLAQHLLGIDAAGIAVRCGQFLRHRIAALAFPPRPRRGCTRSAAALAHRGAGRARDRRDASRSPPNRRRSGAARFAIRCCSAATCCRSCWPA